MVERKILGITPSQTVGPFFHYCLVPAAYPYQAAVDAAIAGAGTAVEIVGTVLDGDGAPVGDAMLEFWQADAAGRYADAGPPANAPFRGFARVATDASGVFRLQTVKPGAAGANAPHIAVSVLGRGLLNRLYTRAYFAGEAANASDPVLALVPAARRSTLIATAEAPGRWRFDIRLQGEGETVFFAV
ncbi:MAG: protocatechuate 3,4-dioxygenase subunit alpha [Telmatospirillum sp.]|nr:protocatechuate 3,4-dioxygenase subunit alpha [Telmatospirillum sp.]